MKKSKFNDVKVVEIVRKSHAEGVAVTARKHKISEHTFDQRSAKSDKRKR